MILTIPANLKNTLFNLIKSNEFEINPKLSIRAETSSKAGEKVIPIARPQIEIAIVKIEYFQTLLVLLLVIVLHRSPKIHREKQAV